MNEQGNKGNSVTRALPKTLYRLIDKDGEVAGEAFDLKWLMRQARKCWPDQEQDEDRTGKGWDVEAVMACRCRPRHGNGEMKR